MRVSSRAFVILRALIVGSLCLSPLACTDDGEGEGEEGADEGGEEGNPIAECGGLSSAEQRFLSVVDKVRPRLSWAHLSPGARDVDGDGFDDLLIHGSSGGAVVFANFPGETTDLDAWVDMGHGFRFEGPADETILSGTIVGDVNGDGLADFALFSERDECTCPGDDGCFGESYRQVYLVHGQSEGATVQLSAVRLGEGGFLLEYDEPMSSCGAGSRLAPAGDVNGDGLADFILGSGPDALFFGKADTEPVSLTDPGESGWLLPGDQLAPAGDLDGDGFDDLVGLDFIDTVVYRGNAAGQPALAMRILDTMGSNSPRCVGLGDVNGDGLDDLGIHENREDDAFHVWFGMDDLPETLELAPLKAGQGGYTISDGEGVSRRSIAAAGDVDGDGLDDILIHDFLSSVSKDWSAYVAFGKQDSEDQSFCELAQGEGGFAIHGQEGLVISAVEGTGKRGEADPEILVYTAGGVLLVPAP